MRCSFLLPLDQIDDADVAALCAELTRFDLPRPIDLVEREAQPACQEGEWMRRTDIPVDHDFTVLPTTLQDDGKDQRHARLAECGWCQPVVATFFATYADVINHTQQREME